MSGLSALRNKKRGTTKRRCGRSKEGVMEGKGAGVLDEGDKA